MAVRAAFCLRLRFLAIAARFHLGVAKVSRDLRVMSMSVSAKRMGCQVTGKDFSIKCAL